MTRSILLITASLATGCALDAGQPYGALEARVEATVVTPPGRDAGDGWQRAGDEFEIRIDELVIEGHHIELIDVGDAALAFDPANPPPGYSACHDGHCHSEETGGLVSYEEISAELAGGGGQTVVAALPVGLLDLHSGVTRSLDCEPSCDLPRSHIGQAILEVESMRASGLVRDSRELPRLPGQVEWSVEIDEEIAVFDHDIDVVLDRSSDPDLAITFTVEGSARWWDEVPWAEVERQGGVMVLTGEAAGAIAEAVAEHSLHSRVER